MDPKPLSEDLLLILIHREYFVYNNIIWYVMVYYTV